MKFQVRIKPFVSAGEVYVHGDGKTFDILPLSVFPVSSGTIFRLGRSTYWFQQDGTYDGPEFMMSTGASQAETTAISQALGSAKDNRGRAPAYAYFSEGSPGWHRETALWPTKPELRGIAAPEPLQPPMIFSRLCDCGWMLPSTIKSSVEVPGLKIKIVCPRCGKSWGSESVVDS